MSTRGQSSTIYQKAVTESDELLSLFGFDVSSRPEIEVKDNVGEHSSVLAEYDDGKLVFYNSDEPLRSEETMKDLSYGYSDREEEIEIDSNMTNIEPVVEEVLPRLAEFYKDEMYYKEEKELMYATSAIAASWFKGNDPQHLESVSKDMDLTDKEYNLAEKLLEECRDQESPKLIRDLKFAVDNYRDNEIV